MERRLLSQIQPPVRFCLGVGMKDSIGQACLESTFQERTSCHKPYFPGNEISLDKYSISILLILISFC